MRTSSRAIHAARQGKPARRRITIGTHARFLPRKKAQAYMAKRLEKQQIKR